MPTVIYENCTDCCGVSECCPDGDMPATLDVSWSGADTGSTTISKSGFQLYEGTATICGAEVTLTYHCIVSDGMAVGFQLEVDGVNCSTPQFPIDGDGSCDPVDAQGSIFDECGCSGQLLFHVDSIP